MNLTTLSKMRIELPNGETAYGFGSVRIALEKPDGTTRTVDVFIDDRGRFHLSLDPDVVLEKTSHANFQIEFRFPA